MRLIDADVLRETYTRDGLVGYDEEIESIDNTPTVPAIPIERIKQLKEEMERLASHKVRPISFDQAVAVDMCINYVNNMIKEYEK